MFITRIKLWGSKLECLDVNVTVVWDVTLCDLLNVTVVWDVTLCDLLNVTVVWDVTLCDLLNVTVVWDVTLCDLLNVTVVWDVTLCDLLNAVGSVNPLNAELNPICHLLALLGVHHFLHVSRIRINLLFVICPMTVHVSKMSVPFYQNTWHHISHDHNLNW